MKNIGYILMVVALIGGMIWYYFSDGQTKKRELTATFRTFNETVATKDKTKALAALNTLLTDDAKIHLSVYFFSIANNRPTMEQDFDKPQFIAFINNILYPLTDYSTTPQLASLDAKTNHIQFTSVDWADGPSMMAGTTIDMRYGSDTDCNGTATFEGKSARLSQINCKLQLGQVPKPGQENKLLDKQGLMGLLGIQKP